MDGDSPRQADSLRGEGLTGDDPLSGLAAWLADARVDEAAAERARRYWLERQAGEDATLLGVLLDLAERRERVSVHTRGGHTTTGTVAAVGADFAVVADTPLGDVVVPVGAIASVRSRTGRAATVGDRPVSLVVLLRDALVELAVDRPLVLVVTAGGDLRGELRHAGADVVAVATAAPGRETVHVAIDAIDHLAVLDR